MNNVYVVTKKRLEAIEGEGFINVRTEIVGAYATLDLANKALEKDKDMYTNLKDKDGDYMFLVASQQYSFTALKVLGVLKYELKFEYNIQGLNVQGGEEHE